MMSSKRARNILRTERKDNSEKDAIEALESTEKVAEVVVGVVKETRAKLPCEKPRKAERFYGKIKGQDADTEEKGATQDKSSKDPQTGNLNGV